ncbi:MAG: asparagine synthase (glutamine-hydrolyzing) [Halobacteriovoraceae bacterium]|nr:asparagine synthase (glutamine-hydrolyzing) [Halobacteriovoraceae bacterium]|tara:strand:- start:153181 stop:155055 length:1875 start_codon:yes stop_codon:yes gene_type:complete
MCGIFCVVKNRNISFSSETQSETLSSLHHRGPDSSGSFQDDNVLLLHTRLKIVDLSSTSDQPFFSQDKKYAMIYNGECYNYKSIRSQLESLGHSFRTEGDTEVLLSAFIEWGPSFIERVAGMFALVIYEVASGKTHVFRDRMGIKPLYVAKNDDGIFLSSEIRPLLKFFKAKLNQSALWSYFNLRFTQGEQTLFEGIKEVPPGSYTLIDRGGTQSKQYWDARSIEATEDQLDVVSFNNLFAKVVSEHNIGDTSVAALLSGGVDSASIVAQSHKCGFNLDTYTFSTEVKDDELNKAKQIAANFGLANTKCTLKERSLDDYRQAISSLEDPLGDSIILPTMLLAKEVSKDHKVVLAGEGADEIFSGYIHHQIMNLENRMAKFLPSSFWQVCSRLFGAVPQSALEALFPYPAKLGTSGKLKLQGHIKQIGNEFERYMSLAGVFYDPISSQIFNESVVRPRELKEYWDSMNGFEFGDRLKRFDLRYWARNYTLHRLERLSMKNSLEGRVPFFDHRIVEFVLKVKSKKLYNLRDPKKRFRSSLKDADLGLAKEVIERKKQAFYLPTEAVFSSEIIKLGKEMVLDNADKRGIYNYRKLESLLHKNKLELLDSKQFQCLYNFELWCQEFLD